MSLITGGLGGKQLLLHGLGETPQETAGSIQARQQSSGVGYVGDHVVIPLGGFGIYTGSVGFPQSKIKPIIGHGESLQPKQACQGVGNVNLFTDEEIALFMMMVAEEESSFV